METTSSCPCTSLASSAAQLAAMADQVAKTASVQLDWQRQTQECVASWAKAEATKATAAQTAFGTKANQLLDAIQCMICFEPLRQNICFNHCGHFMCQACFAARRAHPSAPTCPICFVPLRTPITLYGAADLFARVYDLVDAGQRLIQRSRLDTQQLAKTLPAAPTALWTNLRRELQHTEVGVRACIPLVEAVSRVPDSKTVDVEPETDAFADTDTDPDPSAAAEAESEFQPKSKPTLSDQDAQSIVRRLLNDWLVTAENNSTNNNNSTDNNKRRKVQRDFEWRVYVKGSSRTHFCTIARLLKERHGIDAEIVRPRRRPFQLRLSTTRANWNALKTTGSKL